MAKDKEKSFWKKASDWFLRYPFAIVASVFVILAAIGLMLLGKKDAFNVGGVLNDLFGRDDTDPDQVEMANQKPEDRDQDLEEPDKHGWEQKETEPLPKNHNPFRDRSKIEIEDPETGEKKKLRLPEGIEDKDVNRVIKVKPKLYRVRIKDQPEGVEVTEGDLEKFK